MNEDQRKEEKRKRGGTIGALRTTAFIAGAALLSMVAFGALFGGALGLHLLQPFAACPPAPSLHPGDGPTPLASWCQKPTIHPPETQEGWSLILINATVWTTAVLGARRLLQKA